MPPSPRSICIMILLRSRQIWGTHRWAARGKRKRSEGQEHNEEKATKGMREATPDGVRSVT
eukprot:2297664-Pyramimonas_sp.AAC.1